jgi:hypothetical protein
VSIPIDATEEEIEQLIDVEHQLCPAVGWG